MASPGENPDPVSAFLTGDPSAHAALRRSVRSAVHGFRFREETQDDLVQETMCRLFFNLRAGAFRGDASLVTYAQRIARYVCLEHIRRRRYVAEVDPLAAPGRGAAGDPEGSLLRAEEHRLNLLRLAQMPPECRYLFHLIFIEGLNYAEVAGRLGISLNAVKLRVHRCRLTRRDTDDVRAEEPEFSTGAAPPLRGLQEAGK